MTPDISKSYWAYRAAGKVRDFIDAMVLEADIDGLNPKLARSYIYSMFMHTAASAIPSKKQFTEHASTAHDTFYRAGLQ